MFRVFLKISLFQDFICSIYLYIFVVCRYLIFCRFLVFFAHLLPVRPPPAVQVTDVAVFRLNFHVVRFTACSRSFTVLVAFHSSFFSFISFVLCFVRFVRLLLNLKSPRTSCLRYLCLLVLFLPVWTTLFLILFALGVS